MQQAKTKNVTYNLSHLPNMLLSFIFLCILLTNEFDKKTLNAFSSLVIFNRLIRVKELDVKSLSVERVNSEKGAKYLIKSKIELKGIPVMKSRRNQELR